jgi:hypothetical protein
MSESGGSRIKPGHEERRGGPRGSIPIQVQNHVPNGSNLDACTKVPPLKFTKTTTPTLTKRRPPPHHLDPSLARGDRMNTCCKEGNRKSTRAPGYKEHVSKCQHVTDESVFIASLSLRLRFFANQRKANGFVNSNTTIRKSVSSIYCACSES